MNRRPFRTAGAGCGAAGRVWLLDSVSDTPAQIRPILAGTSQAGRISTGSITSSHIQWSKCASTLPWKATMRSWFSMNRAAPSGMPAGPSMASGDGADQQDGSQHGKDTLHDHMNSFSFFSPSYKEDTKGP